MEKAIDYLRKKGQKLASKRADKEANEGYVIAKINTEKYFAIVIVTNCETDFVAINKEFIDFCNSVADKALESKPKSLEELKSLNINGRTINDSLTDLIGKIGEKLEIAHYEYIDSPIVFAYNHQGNRLATIMGLNKVEVENIENIGHEVTMQIAAMSPVAIDKDDVDPKIIEKEIEIGKEQARLEGKPENLIEKIALGKLNKFYKESTLLNQMFVRDNKITIRQYLNENDKDLTVTKFARLQLAN